MKRRNFIAAAAIAPLAAQNIIEHPTEAQLLGLTEEEYQRGDMPEDGDHYEEEQAEADREYDGSGYAGPNAHQCPVCEVAFNPDEAEVVAGSSLKLIVICPNCFVCQMIPDAQGGTDAK